MSRLPRFILVLLVAFVLNTLLFFLVPVLHALFFEAPQRDGSKGEAVHELEVLVKKKEKLVQERRIRQVNRSMQVQSARSSRARSLDFDISLATGSVGGVAVAAGGQGEIVYEVSQVDKPARMLSDGSPRFPRRAREEGVQGVVDAVWIVDAAGRVKDFEIVREDPEGFGFARSIKREIPKWRFTPASRKKVPVSQRVRKRFSFDLD